MHNNRGGEIWKLGKNGAKHRRNRKEMGERNLMHLVCIVRDKTYTSKKGGAEESV